MLLNEKQKRVIDIIQWILILVLGVVCVFVFINNGKMTDNDRTIQTETTYRKIYESQTIEALKKKNRELYDSIENLSKVESAIVVKYKYKYRTDTITKERFIQRPDSVYHYEADNDTIHTVIDVKATDVDWVNVSADINDKFMVITERDGNNVTTDIKHSENVEVTDATVWRKKTTFKDRLFFGPSVSVGVSPITGKTDMQIGVSFGYNLFKK